MNIILTSYFVTRPDPQRGVSVNPNDPDLYGGWVNTLEALGLAGVIFADHDLCVDSLNVTVMPHELKTGWSTNDERFWAYYDYLTAHKDIDNVFLTDLFDVDFFGNPFGLISDDYDLYCGCGAGFPGTIGDNRWLINKMKEAYGRVYYPDRVTLNAGVIGGRRGLVRDLIYRMLDDMLSLGGDKNINMAAFNKNAHDLFAPDRIMVGPPLTSLFKKYEAGGFAIRHK
jgi:hypothetical protein